MTLPVLPFGADAAEIEIPRLYRRSGAKATDCEDPDAPEEAAQQLGLVRLRGVDDAALPGGRSRLPRAGFGIDLLPAWKFGLRWDYAVESHL